MRLLLIGCEVIIRELCDAVARSPHVIDARFLSKGLHDLGGKAMRAALQEAIDDANTQVSRAESIRKFEILPQDWTEQNGYLTPSFKVKRHAVLRDHHDLVESLFGKSTLLRVHSRTEAEHLAWEPA